MFKINKIFYGDGKVSNAFWDYINSIENEKIGIFLYACGCKLQNLEYAIRKRFSVE